MKDFIDLNAFSKQALEDILQRAEYLKSLRERHTAFTPLTGKSVALYFEKPSLRTRVSFDIGIQELGGCTTVLDQAMAGLGLREPVKDVARTLEGYVDAIVCRIFRHDYLYELSQWAPYMSVINALTDFSHPCQIMADVLTLRENGLWNDQLTLTWVGDPNNVLQSWIELAQIFPINIRVSCPELPAALDHFFFEPSLRDRFFWIKDPRKAVDGADVIYADTWISMGQEHEADSKRKRFQGYTISEELLVYAPSEVKVMHCLPAKRGEEITDGVFEAHQFIIFQQAQNRLHVQKAILWALLAPQAGSFLQRSVPSAKHKETVLHV
jgi:ornithine carbamoyltransferase